MSKKTTYKRDLQIQLDEFRAEVERFKARADKMKVDAKPWHHKQTEILRERHRLDREKPVEPDEAQDVPGKS